MFWKSKSKDTQQSPVDTTQPGAPVTEQPYFNVMPRTRVTMVPEPTVPKVNPLATVAPKVEPPSILKQSPPPAPEQPVSRPQEIRVTTPPAPVVSAPVVTSSPEAVLPGGPVIPKTKKAVKIIGIVILI